MKTIGMVLLSAMVIVGFDGPVCADSSAEGILKSVVKIRATIPKEAESAGTLGTERQGNGVVIDSEGTILTVGYLIREAESIEVTAQGVRSVGARVVGYDFGTGFGLIRAEKKLGVKPIALGKSSAVQTGDSILVAGHGGKDSVQVSRVISRQEFAGYWEYLLDEAIYTLPAFENFSGAALINADGRLVGIGSLFTQVLVPDWGLVGCNISIPIDLLGPIIDDLRKTGRSAKEQRPWLGINAAETQGRIFITKITSGSPAEKAGMKPGDIVLTVDGKEVGGLSDFYRKVWALGSAGVQVPLGILQGSKIRDIKVHSIDRHQRSLSKPKKEIKI
ncbi:MAG: serine protease [Deltaproteobacteria bacterium]|nr:serine protease [Deltaproteobacteria bacterium]